MIESVFGDFMNKILDKLLKGQKVEWLPLGEITCYEQPSKYLVESTLYNDDFETPVLTAGKTFILGYTNECNGIYRASESPVIIFDDFTTANKWVDFDFKAKSSAMKMITSKDERKFLLKFIFYWLNNLALEENTDHKRQWISNFSNKKIPIPPLDVQAEIVRILDAFTALTAELTMREKQYQYYRDKLLTFSDSEIHWKKLGEVVKMQADKHISASQIHETSTEKFLFPCSGGNGIRGFVDKASHKGEYLLIGRQDALCGNVQHEKGNFYATEHAVVVTVSDSVNIDWAYHMLKFMNLNQYASKSAQPGLAVGKLEQLQIPIPSLSHQMKTSNILDKFEILTHSITQDLSKEIALHQK